MAKSPKPTTFTTSPDTSPTSLRLSPDEFSARRASPGSPDASLPSPDRLPETVTPQVLQGASHPSPAVEVSSMPDTITAMLESYLRAITWPSDQVHLLTALGAETGLFTSAKGDTYANILGEGYFQIEQQLDGRYRIFWPAALGEPGPLVTRIEGQPHWRSVAPLRPAPQAAAGHPSAASSATSVTATPTLPSPLPEIQASWLTKAQDASDGIRYDLLGQMYVDMEDGATYQMRKHADGRYQLASRRERNLLAVTVEQVPGSQLWRVAPAHGTPLPDTAQRRHQVVEPDEPTPGPSKRPHLADDPPALHSQALLDDWLQGPPVVAGPSISEWTNWGKARKPKWNDSIEIEGRHYIIVPQNVRADTQLVYLENPLFKPERFDAFEQMLTDTPTWQPKWAVKIADKWTVVENRPFEMPLSQYVAKSVKLLSQASSSAIARAVFNRANDSEVINGNGLRVLFDTFYHWENRSTSQAPTRDLADPLLMLPTLPAQLNADLLGHSLSLPSPVDPTFQRIDFDTRQFNQQWNVAVNTPGISLRKVFGDLLEHSGYAVDRTSRLFSEDTLLFKREGLDAVFMLRFRPANPDGTLHRQWQPETELTMPALRTLIARSKWKQLLEPGKVVFLIGGLQKLADDHSLLFIVREG